MPPRRGLLAWSFLVGGKCRRCFGTVLIPTRSRERQFLAARLHGGLMQDVT